jgi:hypothetical protein
MLLHKRYFGLYGKFDIAQARFGSAIRCNARQDPGTSFLIHQAPRSIDRIDYDPPYGVLPHWHPSRKNQLALSNAFGDENDRGPAKRSPFQKTRSRFLRLTRSIEKIVSPSPSATISDN